MLFDGARVPAANMIGEPGEGWRLAMTVVSHEREPGELGYVGPLHASWSTSSPRQVQQPIPSASAPSRSATSAWAIVEVEMLRLHVCRRLSDRLDGISHGPEGSVDKLLMTSAEQAVGHAALAIGGIAPRRRGRHLAEGVPLQPGPERHGRDVADPAQPRRPPHPGAAGVMTDLRPPRRARGRGRRTDPGRHAEPARAAQRHQPRAAPGAGRAVPPDRRRRRGPGRRAHRERAGLLRRRRLQLPRRADHATRICASETLVHGRQIVTGMVGCRVPIVAAVNGPAVGLGCSLVALSDIVFMAESAHLADPHVLIGLVAADGGPVTWPLLTSLQLAKEYALTGDRIPARAGRRDRPGQPRLPRRRGPGPGDGLRPAHRQAAPAGGRGHQAHPQPAPRAGRRWPRSTSRSSAEDRSFTSPELRANLDRVLAKGAENHRDGVGRPATGRLPRLPGVPRQLGRTPFSPAAR